LSKPPKRSAVCRNCKERFYVRQGVPVTKEAARRWDEERGCDDRWLTPAERKERIKKRLAEGKLNTASQLALLQSMRDCFSNVWITEIRDDRCCEFCKSQGGKIISLDMCQAEMLPPFAKCSNQDDGCRCHYIWLTPEDVTKKLQGR
jgi:hypothetical protein